VAETWITAMATQVFWRTWLCEKVLQRANILLKYGCRGHESPPDSDARETSWKETIDEDPIIEFRKGIDKIARPILDAQKRSDLIVRPKKNQTSAILFGPPGSGKTFTVKAVAKLLGWPIIHLNPGHFIKNGLQLIETTSAEIFQDLQSLHHTVVLFDECDELFRDRDHTVDQRGILSFATASMLPKLQDLHDARRIVFFLGTNYLQNIDAAIRRPGRFDYTLLLDRPGPEVRRKQLEKHGVQQSKLDMAERQTWGCTYDELPRCAEALQTGNELPQDLSVEEYRRWSQTHGEKELNASRIGAQSKEKLKTRWNLKIVSS
jgi:SpoVK/Ycf46/Vps4 family AAA+-type ATPase